MKINDLITVPDIETVIQVSSTEMMTRDELKDRIVESFVITDDIMEGLEAVLLTVQKRKGSGFLLKGNYGSGKSHFIAFLSGIFRYPDMLSNIKSKPEIKQYKRHLVEKRILPVSLTLTDYSVKNSLSDIVLEKISEVLNSNNIIETIWDSQKLISDFNKIILPGTTEQFNKYLISHNIKDIDSFNDNEKSEIILKFLNDENIPFRPFYDYHDIFKNIENIIIEKYQGGLFLLIDELSEFLRARNRGDLVSEDIRFIQFLGELSKNSKLSVLFSMQESIEEVAEISTDGLNRIKDRYPQRINLTAIHLRELVEMRLIIKKENAKEYIEDVYNSFTDSFPEWKISFDDFYSIYPVHPSTFFMLEGISGIFSKTRGMVDFIYTEIKGDKTRHIPGILNSETDTLLYPYRIFDHFKNNLQESIEYHKLVNSIYSSLEGDIIKIFNKEDDRITALKIIKIILLYQILPGGNRVSAEELAHLVMEGRFKLDPEFNYKFIREKILKALERECSFLGVERGETPFKDKFFLQYEENPAVLYENRVKQFIKKNVNIEKQALWFFISGLSLDELPFSSFLNNLNTLSVKFENTLRDGIIILQSPKKIGSGEIDNIKNLVRSECDFVLIIGFPVHEENEQEIFADIVENIETPVSENIFFWKPKLPDKKELNLFRSWYSRIKVYENEYKSAGNSIIDELNSESERESHRLIKELYSAGSVYSVIEGKIEKKELLFTGNFNRTVEMLVRDSLKKLFPLHSRIMPAVEITTSETYNQVILLFRERGEADFNFEGSRIVKNSTDALLKNSNVLKIKGNHYKMSPEPAKSIFIKELLHEIEKNPVSFTDIYLSFRRSRYGIQKDLFTLYIFSLALTGFISIEKAGRILKPAALDLKNIQASGKILPGEDLSPLFLEKYNRLEPFTVKMSSKNIHLQTQNLVWEKLVDFKRTEEDRIRTTLSSIESLQEFNLYKNFPLKKIKESYERLIYFVSKIKAGKKSKEGLDNLIESLQDNCDISNDLEIDKQFSLFITGFSDQVIFIYNYITLPEIYVDDINVKNSIIQLIEYFKDIDNIIISGNINVIIDKFNRFKVNYKNIYLEEHKRVHSGDIVADFEKIILSPGYRILSNLSNIDTVSVKDDLIHINSLIRSIRMTLCQRSISTELDTKPYCECRLKKGDITITPDQIITMIRNGIIQYINALKQKSNKEKIINYVGALQTADEDEKRIILREILDINPVKVNDIELIRLLNEDSIQLVNRALSGNIRFIKKEIRDFYNAIYGRRFRKDELLKIFNDWLKIETLRDEEIIYEITDFNEKKTGSPLPNFLQDEIKKAVKVDDESLRLQAFALSIPLIHLEGGVHLSVLNEIFCIDINEDEIKSVMNNYKSFIYSYQNWEDFLNPEIYDEFFNRLNFLEMDSGRAAGLYNESEGFQKIREKIIELFLRGNIKFNKDLSRLFKFDKSACSEILRLIIDLNFTIKRFYSESGKNDKFNREIFIAGAQSLFTVESIMWLSLNNNILIELIADKMNHLKDEIYDECEKYFNVNIDKWNNDPELNVKLIIERPQDKRPVIIVFDSLRLDMFLSVTDQLNDYQNIKNIKTGLYISPYPSDTQAFRENLFPGIVFENGVPFEYSGRDWIFIKAAERDYKLERVWDYFSENENYGIVLSINMLDEKIHSTRQGICSLMQELQLFCRQTLVPIISNIPRGRSICIVSDHGFIEHKNYSMQNQARYSHGGNSFYERLIGCAEYVKK